VQQDEWAIPSIKIRKGFNLWSLMVVIAIAAVCFASARLKSAQSAAIAIIGSCVVCLASRRYTNVLSLRRAKGLTVGRLRRAASFLVSLAVAAGVIGISDFAFVIGFFGSKVIFNLFAGTDHWSFYADDDRVIRIGIGLMLALGASSCIRRFVLSVKQTGPERPL
jgi:hypothetical protein